MQFQRPHARLLTALLICSASVILAKEEPAAVKGSEIRVLDAEGRVLLSRGKTALAVAQVRVSPDKPSAVLTSDEAVKLAEKLAALGANREELRQFRLVTPASTARATDVLLRAKKISSGARLLFTSASNEAPRLKEHTFPKLELAIQIFPDAQGKTPDIFYADGQRISPDGLTERRARSWSVETQSGQRVSIARSSDVDWKIERLGISVLLTAQLLPDPRERLDVGSFIVYLGSGADEGAPELSPLKLDKIETPARDFIEGSLRVYASGANPYVLSETAVVAEVACPPRPDGEIPIERLPCFFWEGPSGSPAEGEFRFRFAPPAEGIYAVRIAAVTGAGQVRGDAVPFRAGPPASRGSAKVRAGERFFRLDDGSLYQPAAVQLTLPEKKADVEHFRKQFVDLARRGINAARLPLYTDKLMLEGPRAGDFDREVACALDEIFRAAQVRGIQLIVTLESGVEIREHSTQHIYFRETGGPLAAVPEFFRDIAAKKHFQNRLTYLGARYGAFRSVLSWELMESVDESWLILKNNPDDLRLKPNEADLCRRARRDVQSWAEEMAIHMKGMDQHDHLVCVSTALSPSEPWVDLEKQEHLDWIFTHGLASSNPLTAAKESGDEATLIGEWTLASRQPGRAHKPMLLASFKAVDGGLSSQHNALFASLACGLAGPPLQGSFIDVGVQEGVVRAVTAFSSALRLIHERNRGEELRSIQEMAETRDKTILRVSARVGQRGIAAWIQDTRAKGGGVKESEVRLPALLEGVYDVTWIDTQTGASVQSLKHKAAAKQVDRPAEPTVLRVPAFKRDIAVLVVPEK